MSLSKDTLWNLAGSGIPLIAGVVLIPYILLHLGNEAFGVLALIWALIGYFSLFDLGVGKSLTYELGKLRSAKNISEISPTLKAGILLSFLTGIIGSVVMLIFARYFAISWLKINAALQQDVLLSFEIAALAVIPTAITSGLRGALEGLGKFQASNINKIILGICMFVLPALSIVIHGNNLWVITLYLSLARLMCALLALIQLRYFFIETYFSVCKKYIRRMFNFGMWVTVSNIIGPVMAYGDRFFIGAFLGVSMLAFYAIPQEYVQRLMLIPNALSGALLPNLAGMNSQDLIINFKRNQKKITILMLVICLLAAILAYPFFAYWISEEFAKKALPVTLIMCFGIWLNSVSMLPYTLILAKGKPKPIALFHLFELLLYMLALTFLSKNFGLIGASLAWTGRIFLDLIFLSITANKLLYSSHEKS